MRTIAHVTDIHLDEGLLEDMSVNTERNWRRVLKNIAAQGIEEVICGGDIGASSGYSWFFNTVQRFKFSYIIGNHDEFTHAERYFDGHYEGVDELYYAKDEDGYRMIFLDTSAEHVSPLQLAWLKDQLITDRPVMIFIHHPVLNIDTFIDKKYPLHGREEVKQVLLDSGRHLTLFCGHYHMDDKQKLGNITQYVTPAVSYQITKEADHIRKDITRFGYRKITIDSDQIRTELMMFDA